MALGKDTLIWRRKGSLLPQSGRLTKDLLMSKSSRNRRKRERKRQRRLQQQQQQQPPQPEELERHHELLPPCSSPSGSANLRHGDEQRRSFLLGGSSQRSEAGASATVAATEGGIETLLAKETEPTASSVPQHHPREGPIERRAPQQASKEDAAIDPASDEDENDSDSDSRDEFASPPRAPAAIHAKRAEELGASSQDSPPRRDDDAVRDGPSTGPGRAKAAATAAKDGAGADASPFHSIGKRRRTALEAVAFVYPKAKDGTVKAYEFGGEVAAAPEGSGETDRRDPSPSAASPGPKCPPPPPSKSETIDDILFPQRKRLMDQSSEPESAENDDAPSAKTKEPPVSATASDSVSETPSQPAASGARETESVDRRDGISSSFSSPGHLSGLSVEQAVQDKVGCRPRANSTDGELNLPQRGLCDERIVLESYRWKVRPSDGGNICGGAATHHCYPPPPRGFVNLGNTCFLNSTMQCLLYLPPFAQSLLLLSSSSEHTTSTGAAGGLGGGFSPNPQGKANHGKRVTHILRNLFRQVLLPPGKADASPSRHAIAPSALVKALPSLGSCGLGYRFRPGRQEDAHEFLVHLLDAMNDGELRSAGIHPNVSGWRDRLPIPRIDETTFVHRVFGGYFRSQVLCVECGHRSNTYDPFLNLSLEVAGRECGSLSDALREFTRKETLDKKNRWKCSGCERKVCATKQLTVFRPPLALCMQLKRFTFGGMGAFGMSGGFSIGFSPGHGGKKITKPIDFPAHFHLPLSDGRSCAYSLTGLVIHVGGSASSGHYTACVKRLYNGKEQWFEVDDSFVQAVSERDVLKQRDAYLLFYCRQEVKLEFPTPPLRSSMTANEAIELVRKRARARAESIELRDLEEPPTPASPTASGNPVGPIKGNSKQAGASASLKAPSDASRAVKSTLNLLSPQVELSSVDQVKVEPKSPAAEMDSTVMTSNSRPTPPSSRSLLSGAPSSAASASSTSSSSSSDSTSSDSSSADDGTSYTTGAESVESDHHSSHSATVRTTQSNQQLSKLLPETRPIASTTESPPPGRTRIVVDRGAGRGKVEVMLGPRFRKKKTWKPTQGGSETGKEFGLLGNRPVSKWGDNDEANSDAQPALGEGQSDRRAKLEQSEERREKSIKRKVFPDRWDSYLDQGKLKKVKSKGRHEHSSPATSTNTQFQQLQQRKMKRD